VESDHGTAHDRRDAAAAGLAVLGQGVGALGGAHGGLHPAELLTCLAIRDRRAPQLLTLAAACAHPWRSTAVRLLPSLCSAGFGALADKGMQEAR
jgi:hypothetical protein